MLREIPYWNQWKVNGQITEKLPGEMSKEIS